MYRLSVNVDTHNCIIGPFFSVLSLVDSLKMDVSKTTLLLVPKASVWERVDYSTHYTLLRSNWRQNKGVPSTPPVKTFGWFFHENKNGVIGKIIDSWLKWFLGDEFAETESSWFWRLRITKAHVRIVSWKTRHLCIFSSDMNLAVGQWEWFLFSSQHPVLFTKN